jgi:hypothetical protein
LYKPLIIPYFSNTIFEYLKRIGIHFFIPNMKCMQWILFSQGNRTLMSKWFIMWGYTATPHKLCCLGIYFIGTNILYSQHLYYYVGSKRGYCTQSVLVRSYVTSFQLRVCYGTLPQHLFNYVWMYWNTVTTYLLLCVNVMKHCHNISLIMCCGTVPQLIFNYMKM